MHLKKLVVTGFKSFADLTTVPFEDQVTAIVGPNGCGKSNVVDAIRCVIGETSAKQLRGQTMADMIFNGTSQRKPVGKAAIELVFDNSDGRVAGEYAGYAELAIRREVYRDGQSDYFLNGAPCRRRDIIDIFLGTGLGSRSYAIIEQGMISRLIEAKPDEMRVYVEEAAGISKYKQRSQETKNRMARTQDNLDRLEDLRQELEKQLRHLKRQSNAANRYQELKDAEALSAAQLEALRWQRMQQQADEQNREIAEQQNFYEQQMAQLREVEAEVEKKRLALRAGNDSLAEVQHDYYGMGEEIARLEQRIEDIEQQTKRYQRELEESQQMWQEVQESTLNQQQEIEEFTTEVNELSPKSELLRESSGQAQQALLEAESAMQSSQQQWDNFQEELSANRQQLEVSRISVENYQRQITQLQKRSELLPPADDSIAINELTATLSPIQTQAETVSGQLIQLKKALVEITAKIQQQREDNQSTDANVQASRVSLQKSQQRFASLEALQKAALAQDNAAVDQWLQQHTLTNKPRLGQSIKVEHGWELAVETVLGGYFDAICVDDDASLAAQLNTLSEGRVSLVQLPKNSADIKANTLASKIQEPWSALSWLQSVFVADNLQQALQQRATLHNQQSIITADGVWLGVNWARVYKPHENSESVLLRENELAELQQTVAQQQQQLNAQEDALKVDQQRLLDLELLRDQQHRRYQTTSSEHTSVQARLSSEQARLDEVTAQQQRMQEDIRNNQEQLQQAQANLSRNEQIHAQCQAKLSELLEQRQTLQQQRHEQTQLLQSAREIAQQGRQQADEVEVRLTANQSQLALLQRTVAQAEKQMQQLGERREHLTARLSQGSGPLDELTSELQQRLQKREVVAQKLQQAQTVVDDFTQQLEGLENQRSAGQTQLQKQQTKIQQLRMDNQEIVVRKKTIREQLSQDSYDPEQLLEQLEEAANVSDWEQKLEALQRRIQRLGPINLAAIDEYRTLSERKEYLDKQHEDLVEALELLGGAMRKIERETRAKFKETFEKLNAKFQELFPQVFGGGRANLELAGDDLLKSGVIVKAQPPGKRNTTIHMLSGGEKALTAIALIFSMFSLNPSPFCILDEVDAPLDDVNVSRYCQLVKKMAEEVQFIVISHNKVTIEMANYLMGVTMQEPGVSRVVSVDMQEAVSMVE